MVITQVKLFLKYLLASAWRMSMFGQLDSLLYIHSAVPSFLPLPPPHLVTRQRQV